MNQSRTTHILASRIMKLCVVISAYGPEERDRFAGSP